MTAEPTTAAQTTIETQWQYSRRLLMLLLVLPAIAIVVLFLYYPLLFIVQMSLTEGSSYLSPAGPIYTLQNYAEMVSRYLPNVLVTIELAALAAIVDLIFGFPFAYILVRKVRYRNLVRSFMVFPMFGALYIAFGMRFLLLPGGWVYNLLKSFGIQNPQLYGLPSVVFAMALFAFPFMVLNIGTALSNIDPTLEEAAACLGAHPLQTLQRVLLPLSRAGIVAGLMLVFGWSVGAFAEPLLLGSINEQRSLAWTLYQRGVVQTDYGLSTTMGIVLLILAFAVTYVALRQSKGVLGE
ncbi:MAG: ABC transporter permease subunit [Anaerolineae bacterium]|nr:ABC transporter permease subunit [Candidatus Roseilinea sp.]MDW8451624.1 ABC transporter permease subunit [Anaerolineae bacterium]